MERIGDNERSAALAALADFYAYGYLAMDDFESRSDAVVQAHTWDDLAQLFDDLPPRTPSWTARQHERLIVARVRRWKLLRAQLLLLVVLTLPVLLMFMRHPLALVLSVGILSALYVGMSMKYAPSAQERAWYRQLKKSGGNP